MWDEFILENVKYHQLNIPTLTKDPSLDENKLDDLRIILPDCGLHVSICVCELATNLFWYFFLNTHTYSGFCKATFPNLTRATI